MAKADKPDKGGGQKAQKGQKGGQQQGKKGQKGGKKKKKDEPAQTYKREQPPRLRRLYTDEVAGNLMSEFEFKSSMQIPRLVKITVNMGLGRANQNPKIIESAVDELRAITGQSPVVTLAKRDIATFKLRRGHRIGVMVTLRRERMWEFLDRLISIALPRVRDFRGVSPKGFDGRGNYSLGVKEQIIFPEIDYDKIDALRGMDITITTSARTDEEGRALLSAFKFPFRG